VALAALIQRSTYTPPQNQYDNVRHDAPMVSLLKIELIRVVFYL
jgi:hypothetical protein